MLRRWQRVRLKTGASFSVPARTCGRVVKTDNERSRNGYDTLVVWRRKVPHRTWVPSIYLEPT